MHWKWHETAFQMAATKTERGKDSPASVEVSSFVHISAWNVYPPCLQNACIQATSPCSQREKNGVNIFTFFFFSWLRCCVLILAFVVTSKIYRCNVMYLLLYKNWVLGGSFYAQCLLLGLFYLIPGWTFCFLWPTVVMFKCIEQKVVLV